MQAGRVEVYLSAQRCHFESSMPSFLLRVKAGMGRRHMPEHNVLCCTNILLFLGGQFMNEHPGDIIKRNNQHERNSVSERFSMSVWINFLSIAQSQCILFFGKLQYRVRKGEQRIQRSIRQVKSRDSNSQLQ